MSSNFGKCLKASVFGESHGPAIGVVLDGLPSGEAVDLDRLQAFLDRRRPGQNAMTTHRKETDVPEFLSGLLDGQTTGFPLCAVIRNADQHSSDYEELRTKPRPSHADYTAFVKYGDSRDMRGGGHFSGRLTAPLCIAGGICLQLLERRGISIGAHLQSVADVQDTPFPLHPTAELFAEVQSRTPAVLDPDAGTKMAAAIEAARMAQDSVGAVIECAVIGLPAGVGSPLFDGLENRLAAALFGIPAVKGLEFGSGFAGSASKGSENNDPFTVVDGKIQTTTNNSGGINGGISNGMPVVFRAAFKPTPSIGQVQKTIDLTTMEETGLTIQGRHDPCVAVRAVPVIEAVTALALTDILLEEGKL